MNRRVFNRLVVTALIALALVVVISPGIVGRLAERNLADSLALAGHGTEGLVVTEEKFERGWFTAAGRYRIELGDGGTAALIVETRIDHGLVPLTSLAREAGTLEPLLASTVSTLSIETEDGRRVELPGKVYSEVGLSGETRSRYALEAGSYRTGGAVLEWQGAELRFDIDAAAARMHYAGTVEPLTLEAEDGRWQVGSFAFEGERRKTRYGFAVGAGRLEAANVAFERPGAGPTSLGSARVSASSELAEDRVGGRASVTLEELSLPGFGALDLDLDLIFRRLDAASLGRLIEGLRPARAADDPAAALARAFPDVEADLETLLGKGAALDVERLELRLPQGAVSATLRFDLPETARGAAAFSWPGALLALKAGADVRVADALVTAMQAANPQAGTLVAMGFLKRDGDAYVTRAEYARGLVTVNGAPMPLPLGALTGGDPAR